MFLLYQATALLRFLFVIVQAQISFKLSVVCHSTAWTRLQHSGKLCCILVWWKCNAFKRVSYFQLCFIWFWILFSLAMIIKVLRIVLLKYTYIVILTHFLMVIPWFFVGNNSSENDHVYLICELNAFGGLRLQWNASINILWWRHHIIMIL